MCHKKEVSTACVIYLNKCLSINIFIIEYSSSSNRPTLCIMALFDRDPFMCRCAFCAQHGLYSIQTSLQLCLQLKTSVPPVIFPDGAPRGVIPWRSLTGCFLFQACPVLSASSVRHLERHFSCQLSVAFCACCASA